VKRKEEGSQVRSSLFFLIVAQFIRGELASSGSGSCLETFNVEGWGGSVRGDTNLLSVWRTKRRIRAPTTRRNGGEKKYKGEVLQRTAEKSTNRGDCVFT